MFLRCKFFENFFLFSFPFFIQKNRPFQKESIWLGGLFSPEAYITATRQMVAQANHWSLEELHMRIEVDTSEDRTNTFKLQGIIYQSFPILTSNN